jgi:hypothetical protein
MLQLLVTTNVVPSSLILFHPEDGGNNSSETSVLSITPPILSPLDSFNIIGSPMSLSS